MVNIRGHESLTHIKNSTIIRKENKAKGFVFEYVYFTFAKRI